MGKNVIKIGLVQTKVSDHLDRNLETTARLIKQAAKKGAEIVCLQELFAHRYFARPKTTNSLPSRSRYPARHHDS